MLIPNIVIYDSAPIRRNDKIFALTDSSLCPRIGFSDPTTSLLILRPPISCRSVDLYSSRSMRATPGATMARCEISLLRSPPRENMIGTNTGCWDLDEILYPLDVAIGGIFPGAIHNPCILYTFQTECTRWSVDAGLLPSPSRAANTRANRARPLPAPKPRTMGIDDAIDPISLLSLEPPRSLASVDLCVRACWSIAAALTVRTTTPPAASVVGSLGNRL